MIRSILIYLIVLLVFRLMGKRQLGQMQPFELVLTLIIADLATIPMAEVSDKTKALIKSEMQSLTMI